MGEWSRADAIGVDAAAAERMLPLRGFKLSPQHKSLTVRSGVLQVCVGAYIIVHLVAIGLTFMAESFVNRAIAGTFESLDAFEAEAMLIETLASGVFWTSIVVMALCVIAYSVFIFGAARNIERSNAKGLDVSAGMAVGWAFIPIANLFKPYGIMRQIWRASFDPVRNRVEPPVYMALWWLAYIVGNVVSNVIERLLVGQEDPTVIVAMSWVDAGASCLSVLAGILLILIVRQITAAQAAWPSIAPAETPPQAA